LKKVLFSKLTYNLSLKTYYPAKGFYMASLRQIRRRMKSIDSIHEITKAMEMIATFRFKKAETRFTKAKNFFAGIEKLLGNLCGAIEVPAGPFFEKRTIRKKTLLVITADRGLCGSYNTNLVRAAGTWLAANTAFETSLVPVGRIGHRIFKKKNFRLLSAYPDKSTVDTTLAAKIVADLKNQFLTGAADSVEILYAAYRGGLAREAVIPFLGLSYLLETPKSNGADYIYEPDFEGVFTPLLSRYLEARIYLLLLESLTSEQAARRAAMKQATENGEDILDAMTLLRNKTRQASITRELSEIVSGANVV
jgi:F-type H+-transporting ATPase subunit gamma